MKPFKHEIQKKKWDKLRKRRLITGIAVGGCSALAFAGVGVGVGYIIGHNSKTPSNPTPNPTPTPSGVDFYGYQVGALSDMGTYAGHQSEPYVQLICSSMNIANKTFISTGDLPGGDNGLPNDKNRTLLQFAGRNIDANGRIYFTGTPNIPGEGDVCIKIDSVTCKVHIIVTDFYTFNSQIHYYASGNNSVPEGTNVGTSENFWIEVVPNFNLDGLDLTDALQEGYTWNGTFSSDNHGLSFIESHFDRPNPDEQYYRSGSLQGTLTGNGTCFISFQIHWLDHRNGIVRNFNEVIRLNITS